MELERARKILTGYQRELDHEAASRRLNGEVDRPIDLLALPDQTQIVLAQEIEELLREGQDQA